jgi:hypothetical protein
MTTDATRLRSADGHSALDFTRLDGQEALRFIMGIAAMRLDNEGTTADGRAYVVENDRAWETYNDLVTEARNLLGWEAGKPPLDHPEYLECEEEEDEDDGPEAD